MKLLWLNAGLLLPLDKGGKLRTWHVMRHLPPRHDITYLSFEDSTRTEGRSSRHGRSLLAPRDRAAHRCEPKAPWRFWRTPPATRSIGRRMPSRSADRRRIARGSSGCSRPNATTSSCATLPPVVNLPPQFPCPSIIFTHNVEAEIWRRHAEQAANPIAKHLMTQQWKRMLRFEADALARFDLVLAVSEADGATFARLYPRSLRGPVHVVQTGVETDYFTPPAAEPAPAHMVFTGSMDWLPNEDGMTYFCREIPPKIREAEPAATLHHRRAPTPAVRRLAEIPGVEVTGRVDDVRPHIARGRSTSCRSASAAAPLPKIFEAMSMARRSCPRRWGGDAGHRRSRHRHCRPGPSGFAHAVGCT
jgi:hypothetical protein